MSEDVHMVQDEQVVDQPVVEAEQADPVAVLTGEQRVDAMLVWLQEKHGFHAPVQIAPEPIKLDKPAEDSPKAE